MERVNGWVANATHGKIAEVLGKDDVDKYTAMVLTNAVYFRGTWPTRFPEDTGEATFRLAGAGSTGADFMNVTGDFDYASRDGVKVLRLPCEGGRLSMLAVLPDGADGLPALGKAASADLVGEWRQELRQREVIVSLPKFEAKTRYDLKAHLAGMGM